MRKLITEYQVIKNPWMNVWTWIREVRDDNTYQLLVESRLLSRSGTVNPFTTGVEK